MKKTFVKRLKVHKQPPDDAGAPETYDMLWTFLEQARKYNPDLKVYQLTQIMIEFCSLIKEDKEVRRKYQRDYYKDNKQKIKDQRAKRKLQLEKESNA